MLASIIYNHGKFCDDFKSTLKLGAYNLIAQNAKNPYLISVARGDSSFKSALPYISESEKSLQDTTNILRNMYATLRNDADEENT